MHEILRNNVSKKYKPSFQRQGLAQIVVVDDKETLVNGKSARVNCQFFRITTPCLIVNDGNF